MYPKFRQDRTTQAACEFLRRAGGSMNYMKLIKLLYLLDRRSLLERGRPVTYDRYVAMDRGPVLSQTLDLINHGSPPSQEAYWDRHIERHERYAVRLAGECPSDELSEADLRLIGEVFAKYGDQSPWELVDYVHRLPEWHDPNGSAIPIRYEDILEVEGREEREIEEVLEDLRAAAQADRVFLS